MTADDIRAALRTRYPATRNFGTAEKPSHAPDAWTTVCEWQNIDLLAISAWRTPPRHGGGISHPIVGHEIKVSRADYRRELRAPHKRAIAVGFCTQFYFVVPAGLLKPEETAWKPPAWVLDHVAWQRAPCPDSYEGGNRHRGYPTPCDKGKRQVLAEGPVRRFQTYRDTVAVKCETCGGRGYTERSRIEREAPTLWIPGDVGLLIVHPSGTVETARTAPKRPNAPARQHPLGMLDEGRDRTRAAIGEMARWISVRPDPRHASVNGTMP